MSDVSLPFLKNRKEATVGKLVEVGDRALAGSLNGQRL
jgi:hypothetical protein